MTDNNRVIFPPPMILEMQAVSNRRKLALPFDLPPILSISENEWWDFRTVIAWATIRDFSGGVGLLATNQLLNAQQVEGERFLVSAQRSMWGIVDDFSQHGLKIHRSPVQAHVQLVRALRRGEIASKGFLHDESLRRDIEPSEWTDLTIVDGWATRHGELVWSDVIYKQSDVERLFPPIGPDGVEVEIADPIEGEDAPGAVVEAAALVAEVEVGRYPPYEKGMVKKTWLLDRQVTDCAIKALGWNDQQGGKHADFHRKIMAMSNDQIKENTVAKTYRNAKFWDS